MIYEGEWREQIDVAEAFRLMIKQIAGPIQIPSGSVEVALRARRAGSITWEGVSAQAAISGAYH